MSKISPLIQLTLLCSLVFVVACKNSQKEIPVKKNTITMQKDTTEKKPSNTVVKKQIKTVVNSVYETADRLNMELFGKKLKHHDFTINSKKLPECAAILDFKKLVKFRAFLEPTFTKNYISDNLGNYVYFIFEYPNKETAQKILQQFAKESEVMGKVSTEEIDFETLSERKKRIYYNSKGGGIVFNSEQNIIFVKESCSAPNTVTPMQWSTYEKAFLDSFQHDKKDFIVGTGCGFWDWGTYERE